MSNELAAWLWVFVPALAAYGLVWLLDRLLFRPEEDEQEVRTRATKRSD